MLMLILCSKKNTIMNIKSILMIAAATGLSMAANAQTGNWVKDTIVTQYKYQNNVYYSFEKGIAKEAAANTWHIAFSKNRLDAGILANSADNRVKVFELAGVDKDSFGTDLTLALTESIQTNPMPYYNSNTSWEIGAFNRGSVASFDYGWGSYDGNDHWVYGTRVYGIVTPTDTFQFFVSVKKTTVVANAPVYDFNFAKIDGSNNTNKVIELGQGQFGTQNYVYYNLLNDSLFAREPDTENWDILFTNYNDSNVVFGDEWYSVFGVYNNKNVNITRVDTAAAEISNLDYTKYTLDNKQINNIGRAWKQAGAGGVVVFDSITYFAKVENGDIWQLQFLHHISGGDTTVPAEAGLVAFQKRKVYSVPDTNVSVNNINETITNVVLAPNPTQNGYTNIVIDSKNNIALATINIVNITGKVVATKLSQLQQGLTAIQLPVANYPAGIYFVQVQIAGEMKTQKLIIK